MAIGIAQSAAVDDRSKRRIQSGERPVVRQQIAGEPVAIRLQVKVVTVIANIIRLKNNRLGERFLDLQIPDLYSWLVKLGIETVHSQWSSHQTAAVIQFELHSVRQREEESVGTSERIFQ